MTQSRKNRRSVKRKKSMLGGGVKNILLIIDPQNDFTPSYSGWKGGTLAVDGSIEDYGRIIEMIKRSTSKKNEGISSIGNPDLKFDQIHVSLDTHTKYHIGHPAFWLTSDNDGAEWKAANDDEDGLNVLTMNGDKITGKSLVPPEYQSNAQKNRLPSRLYKPVNEKNVEYVKSYFNFYQSKKNIHKLNPTIWKTHCLEDSQGHKIYEPLQQVLNEHSNVYYHLKGQNELTEMYSIFSAEYSSIPITLENYSGTRGKDVDDETTINTYADTKTYKNLNVNLNTILLNTIVGNPRTSVNNVYICGQARTHCVKSSIIDMFEFLGGRQQPHNIHFIKNMSSPIPGSTDNIDTFVKNKYGKVDNWLDDKFVLQEIRGGKKKFSKRMKKRK